MLNVSSFVAEQLYLHKAKKFFPNVKNWNKKVDKAYSLSSMNSQFSKYYL